MDPEIKVWTVCIFPTKNMYFQKVFQSLAIGQVK